jgi:hypothetical protein
VAHYNFIVVLLFFAFAFAVVLILPFGIMFAFVGHSLLLKAFKTKFVSMTLKQITLWHSTVISWNETFHSLQFNSNLFNPTVVDETQDISFDPVRDLFLSAFFFSFFLFFCMCSFLFFGNVSY